MQRMLSRKISDDDLGEVRHPAHARPSSPNCVPIEPPPTWKLTEMPASCAAAHTGSQCAVRERRLAVVLRLVAEVHRPVTELDAAVELG